ncbi:hypothetical protein [Singulisphaera acidiphila]|uniref:Carboxypeptidase regulatory-like domain-containing protein n=1 Tax=Singulisphaera acidiphila (strain ATCC BAA-1392 / DSM 18658 / VKM B-2454 / MOB10) TaxID=886293 RepID=L0DQN5_SINAD|nr:hypothetical protein [Singulisphaera acidiphila]AGA31255.1 hypothetical protein Sinac_7207 [Singulisphaera acidiphila DSM 18658]
MRTMQKRIQFSSVILLTALGGCEGGQGDDLPHQAVSGTVTLDEQPLAHGFIQFQPMGSEGVAAGGSVTDGKYAIERLQGPTPGEYKVLISSSSAPAAATDTPPPPPGAPTAPRPDPIPAKYNTASKLTAKVEAGKANSIDFPMKSK